MIIPFTIVNIFLLFSLGVFTYLTVRAVKKKNKKYTVTFSVLLALTTILLLLVVLQHYHYIR